jgi:hypothetical protein
MWMSKGPSDRQTPMTNHVVRAGTQCTGTAHFVRDGRTLCADARRGDGTFILGPFLCSWLPLRSFDKRCKLCARARMREARFRVRARAYMQAEGRVDP